jgi:hypothetical protein
MRAEMGMKVKGVLVGALGACVLLVPSMASARVMPMRVAKRAAMGELKAKVASLEREFEVVSYGLRPCEPKRDDTVDCAYRIVVDPGYPPLPGVNLPPPEATCEGYFIVTYTRSSPPRVTVAVAAHGCL